MTKIGMSDSDRIVRLEQELSRINTVVKALAGNLDRTTGFLVAAAPRLVLSEGANINVSFGDKIGHRFPDFLEHQAERQREEGQ